MQRKQLEFRQMQKLRNELKTWYITDNHKENVFHQQVADPGKEDEEEQQQTSPVIGKNPKGEELAGDIRKIMKNIDLLESDNEAEESHKPNNDETEGEICNYGISPMINNKFVIENKKGTE